MDSPSLLKVLFLWVLLHLAMSSLVTFQRIDGGSLYEANSTATFISCRNVSFYENLQEMLPKEISEFGDLLYRNKSIIEVYKFPRSQLNTTDYLKNCTLCSYHSIKCAYDGKFVCFRSSVYKGNEKQGDCQNHIVKIKGYLNITREPSSQREIKSEKGEIFLGKLLKSRLESSGESPLVGDFEDDYIPIGTTSERFLQTRSTPYCLVESRLTIAEVSCRTYRSASFVDCNLSLNSGGSTACSVKNLFRGPECTVSCLPYEDKEGVDAQNYTCNIEGKWDPPLPFCVTSDTGLALVKAPTPNLHEEE